MIENCLELGQVPQQPGIKGMTGYVQCSTKSLVDYKVPSAETPTFLVSVRMWYVL